MSSRSPDLGSPIRNPRTRTGRSAICSAIGYLQPGFFGVSMSANAALDARLDVCFGGDARGFARTSCHGGYSARTQQTRGLTGVDCHAAVSSVPWWF
ncbi:hypothetical protein BZL29_5743 [Mycobacterium kansasii]|uniref:Uncharacterized protein n=1 Tax=Mycobacterium kansasii TaxID=1768 RepID=A0A1V3WX11_MYCKA|nr:hypothetical protein BZL29_5743 [Mycobacterium kansasii]